MYPLLLLSSLLHITTGSIHNVTPDDHYYPNATCHHCHNLQHYLLNTTKYFTSNTQLLFLPGLHHLHTDLIIQNVHNIALIGSTTNGTTPDTVIQCNSSVGIIMTNITNLIVTNITVRSCLGNEYNKATVLIKQCTNVQLRHVVIEESHNSYGIVGINIIGSSHFSYITNNAMEITYNDDSTVDKENHSLIVDHYHINVVDSNFQCKVNFTLLQQFYRVNIYFMRSTFQGLINKVSICATLNNEGIGHNSIIIRHCQFANCKNQAIYLRMLKGYIRQQDDMAFIENCQFYDNNFEDMIHPNKLIVVDDGPNIYLRDCEVHHNWNFRILRAVSLLVAQYTKVVIANTTILSSSFLNPHNSYGFFELDMVDLHLIGPVIFHNITNASNIIKYRNSKLTCYNYVEFSKIVSKAILRQTHTSHTHNNIIFIEQNTVINVTGSRFEIFAQNDASQLHVLLNDMYPSCYFQYLSSTNLSSTNLSSTNLTNSIKNYNYSIVFDNNYEVLGAKFAYNNLPLIHCSWLPQSAFNTTMPPDINKQIVIYKNASCPFNLLSFKAKRICYCNTNSYDCYKDTIDHVYPGQITTLKFYMNFDVGGLLENKYSDEVVIVAKQLSPTACVLGSNSVHVAKTRTCNALKYSIYFPNLTWCELFLKGYTDDTEKMEIFYIRQRPCPVGFMNVSGICRCKQCHAFLKQFNINCDINDQLLSRPANSWILLQTGHNTSCVYQVSLHCPYHYCLPHSTQHNFSTPNSQCQFNRSGILCGHCQQGLSTVLGSSQCQQCSNIYLFLIVPIAIAGLVLVLLLFIFNLTVTDGTINAFILYVNIIGINVPVFFPTFTPAYTFISLANLDLGIQTCFYNGMDDYAKMWLQLAFPFYLIFIATSLIITSRYSTTIQRLTARRALPVLATLFLLSYTKILLTISSVLFYYSRILHLPSEHIAIVWSVDANVTLLGVKFIVLYITCLILFIILIPFNVILLFTKTFSRFRCISKFRPLLDAYQGPYKIKFYYWTGVQLLIRTILYGTSSLDRHINLTIGMILLCILAGVHGTLQPFKKRIKNHQELLLILNLQVMYTFSLYGRESVTSVYLNIMISLAAVHFMLIVLYHIITYVHGGVMRQKMMLSISRLRRYLNGLYGRQQVQQFVLDNLTRERIPEVTQHYDEFQEPLVGQSF